MYQYDRGLKRVCFHSREIRRNKGPFSQDVIDFYSFVEDINIMIEKSELTIFSSSIDKLKHVKQYTFPVPPYELCLRFVLERIVKYFLAENGTCALILEARGKKEDGELHKELKNIIDNGTKYTDRNLYKKIKGVYFNQKWCKKSNEQKSYFGLELSDLCSHPIHKYSNFNIKNKAFDVLEKKIYKYPNYIGKGIKIFP